MESSDEETESGVLKNAYSFSDMLDELDTEDSSVSLVSEGPFSPSSSFSPEPGDPNTKTSYTNEKRNGGPEEVNANLTQDHTRERQGNGNCEESEREQMTTGNINECDKMFKSENVKIERATDNAPDTFKNKTPDESVEKMKEDSRIPKEVTCEGTKNELKNVDQEEGPSENRNKANNNDVEKMDESKKENVDSTQVESKKLDNDMEKSKQAKGTGGEIPVQIKDTSETSVSEKQDAKVSEKDGDLPLKVDKQNMTSSHRGQCQSQTDELAQETPDNYEVFNNSGDHTVSKDASLSDSPAVKKRQEEECEANEERCSGNNDPVWKRKRVIKKKKTKKSLDSQSSTSFESEDWLSNSGSFDGETSNTYQVSSPTLEKGLSSADNPTYVSTATRTLKSGVENSTKDDGYEPIEFRAQLGNNGTEEDIYENIPNSDLYHTVKGRTDPRRSTLRRGTMLQSMGSKETLDMTYKGSQKLVKVLPDEHPQKKKTSGLEVSGGSTLDTDGIYESIAFLSPVSPTSPTCREEEDEDYDNYSWGSSEFESYDEDDERPVEEQKEPISVTVNVKTVQEPTNQTVLNKLAAKIGTRSRSRDDSEDVNTYLEVTLNMEKHPPPELPPPPPDLTPSQMKRRLIVASIVESERSYTNSLRRIMEDYHKPLLLAKPQIISKNSIKVIFYRISDILQCHNMFHIELAEYIRVWDTEEKIGNVFTASFSKSMVFDVYSEFVNNFTFAMESAKKLAKQKHAFSDFLKMRVQTSSDKLSLFGLMVKPIQRFPQFILCLQDLLKHTSHEHHDRLSLQLALTELETLTHKLNEMKRESENRHEVKKIISAMTGRFSLKQDLDRCMVRQDDMLQMDCTIGSNKNKPRRLFMMNDQLICTTVVQKDRETGIAEKFKFKWSVPIRDVDVVEVDLPDLYQVKGGPGRSMIVAPKLDKSTYSPWKKELDDMMHDLAIIEQISNLTSQLRLSYQNLNTNLIFGIQRGLQLAIQDQGDVDKCILHLSLPAKTARMIHTFQVQSASIKQDWLLELKTAKLALDPNNKPGWYVPETDQAVCVRLPLFVKPLLIDVTKQETRVQCAIPVMFPYPNNPVFGVQHLWVCSNDNNHGQVTIVSLHSSQPHVMESFSACDAPIVCAEFVPGLATFNHEHAFPKDTVWMAMESNELCVRCVVEENRDVDPLLVMDTDDRVTCLRFMDDCLYIGLERGQLVIYNRDRDGVWQIKDQLLVDIGDGPINSLLPLNHEMWVACQNKIHIIKITPRWRDGIMKQDIQQSEHEVGGADEEVKCMVKAGAGLMVSFRGCGIIRIFNQETFHHLQDINIASSVAQILEGKDLGDQKFNQRSLSITAMLASKGLLWVGTCCGCTLTLPLPRLEGVPHIKGRPSVSYHAHLGPIKFISPIHCGMSQLQVMAGPSLSSSPSPIFEVGEEQEEQEEDSDPGSASDAEQERVVFSNRGVTSLIIEGATESDTNCDDPVEEQEKEDHLGEVGEEEGEGAFRHLKRKGARSEYLSTSMLNINHQGTIGKTKWLSTPDLRAGSFANLTDSEEDVMNLYNDLLSSTDYERYDVELMMGDRKKRRASSEMVPSRSLVDDSSHLQQVKTQKSRVSRRSSSKYATLPALLEDAPGVPSGVNYETSDAGNPDYSEQCMNSESTPDDSHSSSHASSLYSSEISEPESPKMGVGWSRMSSIRSSGGPAMSTTLNMNKNISRSVVVVTGGEGHINWAEKNAGDTKYEDICLLLWQCRI